jgi:hypothetical protein
MSCFALTDCYKTKGTYIPIYPNFLIKFIFLGVNLLVKIIQKLLQTLSGLHPKRLYQAYRSSKFDLRHAELMAYWKPSIDEGKRYRLQRQLDQANRAPLDSCPFCKKSFSPEKMASTNV